MADDLSVSSIRGHLDQIIINVATNAKDAIGSNEGVIKISAREIDSAPNFGRLYPKVSGKKAVVISISDSGAGMSEEEKSKIFDPFYSSKTVDQGVGLGLSQVHGLLRSIDGAIDVISEKEKGSQFNIYLP